MKRFEEFGEGVSHIRSYNINTRVFYDDSTLRCSIGNFIYKLSRQIKRIEQRWAYPNCL